MTIAELILNLQAMNPETVVVADIWTATEIREVSEDLENLSDENCDLILEYLNDNIDTEYGINNERVYRIAENMIGKNNF